MTQPVCGSGCAGWLCVCARVCVCKRERERVCVPVWLCVCACLREREIVCLWLCVCVCLRESVRLECGSPLPPVCVCVRRPGGVFDRLSTPHNFTGVYRRAWLSDGRINHFADTGVSSIPTAYEGDTNTRTDEHIADISVCVRPPPPFPPRACVREPSCTHPVPCACESILILRVGVRACAPVALHRTNVPDYGWIVPFPPALPRPITHCVCLHVFVNRILRPGLRYGRNVVV